MKCIRRSFVPFLESLEDRLTPSTSDTIAINTGQVVRSVNDHVLGVNAALWDSTLTTPQTQQLVQAAGLTMVRIPGGSSSDSYHFTDPPLYSGAPTAASMAGFITGLGDTGLVTLDYGSGSPQEAAAFLAYLNAAVSDTTAIGHGPQWSDASSSWVDKDWKTAGYWASLRAATPLAQDDGLNVLRPGRTAPFAIHYFEVGNEIYGNWETDHHGQAGSAGYAHDPATYVAFAVQFAGYAVHIDPTISIGVVTGSIGDDNNWTSNVLQIGASQGFTPGFLSDHQYMQAPGSESDSNLLLHTVTDPNSPDPNSPLDWSVRAAGYRQLLQKTLGSAGSGVELLLTEFNSVYASPGKQTTSLVNGLFLADSLGSLLQSQYNAGLVWDLHNGWETGNNNSSSLYGWRQGGDYGLLGPGDQNNLPATGANVPYASYFAEQLVSKIVHDGDTVVQASSNDPYLSAYAVQQANGHLGLLVINKSPTTDLTAQFQIAGFQPGGSAVVWQYGKAQDTAQSQTSDGHSALASSTLTLNGASFSNVFPSYSMTVLDLSPASNSNPPPTVATPARATPNPVTGKTVKLSVLGADAGGEANLTYSWATTGTPPASVAFSANGTNAAKNSTATFSQAGIYAFQVTITNAAGLSVTSNVTVTVKQTFTRITVSPASPTITVSSSQQFTALASDQFGHALTTQPHFTWSILRGKGKINSSGLFTAPTTAGTTTVQAASGSFKGTASVTIAANSTPPIDFADTDDWGSGFVGQLTIHNNRQKNIARWTLSFDFAHNITDIWNAVIVSHTGNHYILRYAWYNATIEPGTTVTIGFVADPGNVTDKPSNYSLQG